MLVPNHEPERGVYPLYSCCRIHIRARCAAALTIVLQKLTLPDRPNFQPPSFRMKWQMLSVPWSRGLRFKDVVITSEVPFPTRRYGRPRWDARKGSAFGDLLPRVVSASQVGQQLRANVGTTSARIEHTKLPVMNTCAKRGGGYPQCSDWNNAVRGGQRWERRQYRCCGAPRRCNQRSEGEMFGDESAAGEELVLLGRERHDGKPPLSHQRRIGKQLVRLDLR
jgi:hypothetical protein